MGPSLKQRGSAEGTNGSRMRPRTGRGAAKSSGWSSAGVRCGTAGGGGVRAALALILAQ